MKITAYKFFRVGGVTDEKLDVAEEDYETKVDKVYQFPGNSSRVTIFQGVPTVIFTEKEALQTWIANGMDQLAKRKRLF
jgi:hypothetical protein